ncbi:hypothetical protein [Pedobacter nutrimenti]|jgi:hypothetical protein|uniref:hypothetical protein n=1 Tax=Pedobacter nutrimenti TaxID=1241337 RepID=UPI00292DEA9E|nr:hypothetical protein [Pedobacter nutrimenti]
MKKILSILGSMLLVTAVRAQTTEVKKETVNPGSGQTTSVQAPPKDPKAGHVDPKKEAEAKLAAERAAKDAKNAQHVDSKTIPAKDPKAAGYDPKKEEAARVAAERAAKDAKIAQHVDPKTLPAKDPKAAGYDPKKEAADKAAKERAAKDANILHKGK